MRIEQDFMGEIEVPNEVYWGAQTQRSIENFDIGEDIMPEVFIKSYGIIKKAAASANFELGYLDETMNHYIAKACDEIISGALGDQFPLKVWQTGSGTQTNMNVNEVIANRANELAGTRLIRPNDHVNMSQSSNDTFPTAMHLTMAMELKEKLIPELEKLITVFKQQEEAYRGLIKTGRTHLQDATPIAFSQEISAWRAMLKENVKMIEHALPQLYHLALGGTAVGTGLNAPKEFSMKAIEKISVWTKLPLSGADNKFHALASKDAIVFAHGALKALAANIMKIANDIRWLASGPRCGLGEISIPANEPGSSIMPGKVNPTQCEAVTMVAVQVMGNDSAIGIAASQGNFQLNTFMPMINYNALWSIRLLSDAISSFRRKCISEMKPDAARMAENLEKSLMLATALNPHIGYEKAARVAQKAYQEGISLEEACISLDYLSAEQFRKIIQPELLI
jgi:fumarate hydratase class II